MPKIDEKSEAKYAAETQALMEAYLLDKYNEEFTCEVEFYFEEFARPHRIRAYPKANPEMVFNIWYNKGNGMIQDYYNNVRYADEVNDYFYDLLERYLADETVSVRFSVPLPTGEISPKSFKEPPQIDITVYDLDRAAELEQKKA